MLEALRGRRSEVEARERALQTREAVMAAAERRLSQRVEEMSSLQSRLENLERQQREREEQSWTGLVKLYEGMRPREASTIFNDLDMTVLVQIVHRMKESKAGPVLAAMAPDKARILTTELAQFRSTGRITPRG
jgi:flagellar motility protein MotE (MotC chaperone)